MLSRHRWNLPSPNIPSFVAGLRPFRHGSFRLEIETLSGKTVVHNYGHGGAGITMCWGCAHEVRDIIAGMGIPRGSSVAVLGAGAMGLTAATLLRQLRLRVTVYAKDFTPNTTSDVAGGQWAPSIVEYENTSAGTQQLHRILRRSFHTYRSLMGRRFGVSRRCNYTPKKSKAFALVPTDIVPEPRYLSRLPFKNHTSGGYAYKTLLVEPPIFLHRLKTNLTRRGVAFVESEFCGPEDVAKLDEATVVNCTGLGSKEIWPDNKLVSIKGQLALLRPQHKLKYLYSGNGYLFPRRDSIVVGGSTEYGNTDPEPDSAICGEIIARMKKVFEGGERPELTVPSWLYRDVLEED